MPPAGYWTPFPGLSLSFPPAREGPYHCDHLPHRRVRSSPCLSQAGEWSTPTKDAEVPGRGNWLEEGHLPRPHQQGLAGPGGAPPSHGVAMKNGPPHLENPHARESGEESPGLPRPSSSFPSGSCGPGDAFPNSHGPSSPLLSWLWKVRKKSSEVSSCRRGGETESMSAAGGPPLTTTSSWS